MTETPDAHDRSSTSLWLIRHVSISLALGLGLYFAIALIPGGNDHFDPNVAAAQAGMSSPAEQGFIMICAGPIIRWVRGQSDKN